MEDDKKKKVRTAVALAYDPADTAPTVVASGKGFVADKIIEEAKKSDVPVHTDGKLAETLSSLEIGEAIPPELYEVVAEVLVFVDRLEKLKTRLDDYNANKTRKPPGRRK
ncbi:MAG: EscU/YscU/HrcU family type III secretion system export apparatus switch protein [Lachnospiraceae bacterium]|nr:EscU/YscU/HrcU family type III secretion system export apparatus switch protein [Lachnospiraceae bacterium]